ncbi:DUF1187 family protein [Salmonella enterica subsp. enterica serovar Eastbourne]|nr:DUF1187 family protein [Salmonella enterica subsp. enterica serovar Eastbourne]EHC5907843.1 DUF1187 family protein [Salmonella enterica subsp. enterica serovar Eastbourne]EJW4859312.1 DUF1187 family protein [Salmonella enterica]
MAANIKNKRYKITATIHKVGNTPVSWVYYSPEKLTRKQCEAMFYKPKEAGRSHGESVMMQDFCCEIVTDN